MTDDIIHSPNPTPAGRARLVVVPTRDIIEAFRQEMAPLQNNSYDINEIGAVFVECMDRVSDDDPIEHMRLREGFCDHFSRQHVDIEERDHALHKYHDLFDRLEIEMMNVDFTAMGAQNHYGISYHDWIGDDLVVLQHPLPY